MSSSGGQAAQLTAPTRAGPCARQAALRCPSHGSASTWRRRGNFLGSSWDVLRASRPAGLGRAGPGRRKYRLAPASNRTSSGILLSAERGEQGITFGFSNRCLSLLAAEPGVRTCAVRV